MCAVSMTSVGKMLQKKLNYKQTNTTEHINLPLQIF